MKRTKLSLSHHKLMTGEMGKLIPVGCVEVLPGDSFNHQASTLIRVTPQLAPVMHGVNVRLHHFYVPNRLLWSGWEDFITGGADGNDASVIPTVSTGTTPANNPLLDYLGVPQVANTSVNALPVRAYNKIFNEYYRDQDLVSEVSEDSLDIQNIAWEKDRFTSARPWQQKGDSVSIPFGSGEAPVSGIGFSGTPAAGGARKETDGTGTVTYTNEINTTDNHDINNRHIAIEEDPNNAGYPNVRANLSGIDAIDIPSLREGLALQRYKEARARYGSRYTEYLRYCGVTPSDARLQRPEYLAGGKQTISFSEVLATSNYDPVGNQKLGYLGGHGIAALRSNRYQKFFEEHGFVITLMSVRPKAMYNDTTHKMFLREEKEDYFQKELQHIGQQEITNRELYTTGTPATDDAIFGYCDRYREYTEHPSSVHKEMRVGDVLDHWHLARSLGGSPTLNQSFIECNPTDRVFADTTQDALWIMVNHNLVARRPVVKSAKPRIL